ncbi:MAG: hypothetical protein ACFE9L_07650 [Candidatus Hodarchaeota archaeon]
MENDVIFSVFDVKKGPLILYSSLDPPENAQKIAVRSYIAIGAMEEDQDLRGRQAVVPIPSLGKIALYYMFRININIPDIDKKHSWATIGFINDSADSIDFYKSMPILQTIIIPIVELIQEKFTFKGPDSILSKEIKERIETLRASIIAESNDITPSITIPDKTTTVEIPFEDFKRGDLTFLFEYFPEDLGKVIYSLMLEEPVLIIGDIKDIVTKVVASLEILIPHRLLSKEYLTTYIDPKEKDLLISSSHVTFLKKYKNITNVNIITRQVSSKIRGVPSIENLITTLKIAPRETQKIVINKYIDTLLGKTAELMELCEKDQVSREEIRDFRGQLNADELNIVISMVRKYAPQFEGKLFHFARSLI